MRNLNTRTPHLALQESVSIWAGEKEMKMEMRKGSFFEVRREKFERALAVFILAEIIGLLIFGLMIGGF
jgi:hypothetical protein